MNKIFLWCMILIFCFVIVGVSACFFSVNRSYKYGVTKRQILSIAENLKAYYLEHGQFPPNIQEHLLQQRLALTDQWGGRIEFEVTEKSFMITSRGSDRKLGGQGAGTDISVSWKAGEKDFQIEAAAIGP